MAESSKTQVSPPFAVSANSNPRETTPSEFGVSEKRQRNPSRKALQSAVQNTTAELSRQAKALRRAADSVYASLREKSLVDETKLHSPAKKYEKILNELEGLYAQDKWGDTRDEAEIIRQSSRVDLEYARTVLNKARATQFKEPEEEDRASRRSRCSSRVSSSRTSSSTIRTKALAEAAVARKQAEYDRLMVEKEHERRQCEAEENQLREQRRARHDRDMAILAADKVAAVAEAKLAAIERLIKEEEKSYTLSRNKVSENASHRTQQWVNAQEIANRTKESAVADRQHVTPLEVTDTPTPLRTVPQETPTRSQNRSYPQTTKVQRDMEYTEAITATNKQLITSLARQSLPKCHPDTFGDAAMMQDADIPPDQEVNYLRQYTKGDAQRLVDSYRKRQYRDPSSLLQEVWTELGKRFGNAAVITNALLKKLSGAAKFNEKEREKLQMFADICADVDSRLEFLPGLAYLNYPNAIKPIAERLPHFLQCKWEKQVADYAERNHDAYPDFHDFAVLIQKQATLKNHPNILAVGAPAPKEAKPTGTVSSRSTPRPDAKVFVSIAKPVLGETINRPNEKKHCLFHDTEGHDLTNCKAFERKPLAAKTEWVMRAGLCFRCLSPEHRANACTAVINCEKCGSSLHNTLLHREKRKPETEGNGEELKTSCTGAPWAQKLKLGWTVSGQVCLNRVGGPVHISANRTTIDVPTPSWSRSNQDSRQPIVDRGSPSCYETAPCPNHFVIKEEYAGGEQIGPDVYHTTDDDNEVSLSQEDHRFLDVMKRTAHKNKQGNWEMPLPFRSSDVSMPNNRSQAVNRLNSLLQSFKRKPQLEKDYLAFMAKTLDRGHAARVPPNELTVNEETNREKSANTDRSGRVWYLPHFGVYHPKKPDQIRVVFNSSAQFQGVSLNKELLPGPDQMNSLLGVLVRFRQEDVTLMCDVEQMFHSFYVNPEHRDFLRFLWFKDNNPLEEVVEYRMLVHLFGNVSSPAIATYGMRRTAEDGEEEFGSAAKEFIYNDFYVDDGLTSRPTDQETIELLKNTQAILASARLRLHKAVSNSVSVMEALPVEDRGKNVRDLDLHHDSLPTQRSLGVHWDLEGDAFTFHVVLPEKPYTRRGVLSVINSVYDPLGLAAPVILKGKLLLRQLVVMGKKGSDTPLGWDDPLPERLMYQWQSWRDALVDLENIHVPRCYHPKDFGRVATSEIHSFSDASKDGIGVATYLRQVNESGEVNVAFLFGQARMAPLQPTTIPRLELCGAVLSSQAVKKLLKELSLPIHEVVFYTDSKVTLGYIQNDSRRYYVYVANRAQIIRNVSDPSQWRYINTALNPADLATRGIAAENLKDSKWLSGPEFLKDATPSHTPVAEVVALDAQDPEVRSQVVAHITGVNETPGLGSERFSRFSRFASLRRALANLIDKIKEFKSTRDDRSPRNPNEHASRYNSKCQSSTHKEPERLPRCPSVEELRQAEMVMIRAVQSECFADEIESVEVTGGSHDMDDCTRARQKRNATKKSNLHRLDPFLDDQGVLRVGGRLRRSNLSFPEKHPVLLPKGHHLSHLVVRHQHEKVHHQGRQITHGAVRTAGYWIVGGHGVVSRAIRSCVTCKRLRGASLTQHMADLPSDRTETPPPFTNVGCDVFGPWMIQTRKLRGGAVNSKRWGLVFTCLNSRAVHIEVLESMDASAFICALRRFFSIRGPAAIIRCDRGSNFVGGKSELDQALQKIDERTLKTYLTDQGCEWSFNPPHASHFGGVWERQIRTIRRVLDAMLLELGKPQLTHELLVTLLAEVSAIVNARPIATIPSDVEDPQPLSPTMLLTLKTCPLLPPYGNFTPQDLYARRRWRRVQYLADQFWIRWRREYLQSLQKRPKWNEHKRNLAAGDIVLVKDKEAHCNDWQLGKVVESITSDDGEVRKAIVLVCKEGVRKTYLRPISELVLIVQSQDRTHTD